jgi:hypothetical protein
LKVSGQRTTYYDQTTAEIRPKLALNLTIYCDLIYKGLNHLQLLFSRHSLVGLAQTCLLMRITRLRLILLLCAHLQHTKLALFQPLTAYFKAKTVGSRSRDRNLMFYEGVRFIVFAVAVRWDPIHKRLRKIFSAKNFLLLH